MGIPWVFARESMQEHCLLHDWTLCMHACTLFARRANPDSSWLLPTVAPSSSVSPLPPLLLLLLAVDDIFKALCDCAALNPDEEGEKTAWCWRFMIVSGVRGLWPATVCHLV